MVGIHGERTPKPKKVLCYVSPKQLIIKELILKFIPKRLFTFRLCPSTKVRPIHYYVFTYLTIQLISTILVTAQLVVVALLFGDLVTKEVYPGDHRAFFVRAFYRNDDFIVTVLRLYCVEFNVPMNDTIDASECLKIPFRL